TISSGLCFFWGIPSSSKWLKNHTSGRTTFQGAGHSRLRPGRATYAIACWDHGGVLVDGVLIQLAADRFWYVQAEGDFFAWARAHAMGMDVEITDPGSWVHQIQGPKAMEVLADACDHGAPEDFRYFDAREVSMGGQQVMITRTGWTGELEFEIYTRPGLNCDRLWEHISAAGARHGMLDIGLDAMDIRRIEAEILNAGSDMDATTTLFAVGLGGFVTNAGDFFGQAALERADGRVRLLGLACKTAEPLIGGPVARGGREIGTVTASGWSPFLDQGVAYVRLADAGDATLGPVEVMGFDLAMHRAKIVALPFYDSEKRIARGLEAPSV
ncbi:MAG: aminomethyl transferase family protein, partial [Alphaproteobacteria bacterium]|nr:aminomethyl transferase family protein [Alphaproteobacteria bacterium]